MYSKETLKKIADREAKAMTAKSYVMGRKIKQLPPGYFDDGGGESDSFEQIATDLMRYLESVNQTEFVLLKHEHIRSWWNEIKKQDRIEETKKNALGKLTDEEKKILGLDY
jgi:hypothetical protein